MKFIRFFKNRRVMGYAAGFLAAGAVFVLTDAILKQNSLKITGEEGAHKEGEYGALVNWLPKEAKIAIEYRARSLYLQNRMKRTKNRDMKVRAIYEFGDYIRHRDPKGSDSVFCSIVEREEFKHARTAYLGYGELLLKKTSAHPVSVEELHAYLKELRWPEDIYEAWNHIHKNMSIRGVSNEVRCRIYEQLFSGIPHYRNFQRFFDDAARTAGKLGREDLKKQAGEQSACYKKYPWIPGTLLKAPVTYRETYEYLEKDLKKVAKDEEIIRILTSLGMHCRNVDNADSMKFFGRIFDTPEYFSNIASCQAQACFLLYSNTRYRISIPQYHELLTRIETDEMLYMAWEAGYRQLRQNKNSDQVLMQYLRPLTHLKKEYVEYAELFRKLEELALILKDDEVGVYASKFLVRVQETEMPSLFHREPVFYRGEF